MMKMYAISSDFKIHYTLRLATFFVLAPKILNDTVHQELLRHRTLLGCHVILDNGAAEHEVVSQAELLQLANLINADEVVLPDLLRDSDATLRWSTDAHLLRQIRPLRRFVVPQGSTWDEWTYCLRHLVKKCQPGVIGVPKWIEEGLPGGRKHALEIIEKLGYHKTCHIHLLGLARLPKEEFMELARPYVRSFDTALPMALAQHGQTVRTATSRCSFDWGKPYNSRLAETSVYQIINILEEVNDAYHGKRSNR